MSEDGEDYDELPPITVNSSGRDTSRFAMPCALEVAEQRACAERCEAELRRLRAEHAAEVESAAGEVPHSDSSGSEGEAALSAAVAEMRMRATGRVAPPPLAALLRVAAPRLPAPAAFTAQYARAAAAASPAAAESLSRRTLRRIQGAVVAGEGWSDERDSDSELACCAWACFALSSAELLRDVGGTRAAHALLERVGAVRACSLASALQCAVPAGRARLRLGDALRAGGASSAALANALECAALVDLLDSGEEEERGAAQRWRRLDPSAQHAALQVAGRARAHHAPDRAAFAARLLRTAHPPRDLRPDSLKVQVAASKLLVLFPTEK